MLGGLLVAAVAAIVALVLSDGASPSSALADCGNAVENAPRVAIGDRVPDFTLPSLNGGCVSFRDLRGQPAVINFWASWCNPCRREFPEFRDAQEHHESDGLEIVGITHDDIVSDSQRFARERHANWKLLADEQSDVADMFRVGQIPQTIFVDRQGKVRSHVFGFTTARQLEREIRALLGR